MRIDIIIPAYKAQETIISALSSIACQTYANRIDVTIVNDADGIGYEKYTTMFSDVINVRELTMKENGGPGNARQYGIDNTQNPIFMFMDADDVLFTIDSVQKLVEVYEYYPYVKFVRSSFSEECVPGEYLRKEGTQADPWTFGKLYDREFILNNNIRFYEKMSSSNEDVGFNKSIDLCISDEQLYYIPDITYLWRYKEDSITRVNDHEYTLNQGTIGFSENMINAIKKHGSYGDEKTCVSIANTIMEIYMYYNKTLHGREDLSEQTLNYASKVYNEIYEQYGVTESILIEAYCNRLEAIWKYSFGEPFTLRISLEDFIEKLKGSNK